MVKRLFLGILLSVWVWTLHAQWERKDSLRLQDLLQGQGEIRLNPQAVKEIDMKQIAAPMMERGSHVLEFDLTLPEVLPERKKIILTLSPYKPNTRFNYDPIEQKNKSKRKYLERRSTAFHVHSADLCQLGQKTFRSPVSGIC